MQRDFMEDERDFEAWFEGTDAPFPLGNVTLSSHAP